VGFAVLAVAVIFGVVAWPFLLLAVVPFVLGILLTVGRRTAVGVTMIVLALALPIPGAILIQAVAVKSYRVPSASMEPTLQVGARILVNRTGVGGVGVGDIVVFHPPKEAEQEVCGPTPHMVTPGGAACSEPESEHSNLVFIKRIVAGPGDTIFIREGHVYRNGVPESDSYIRPCGARSQCNFPTPIKIPPGYWFMLGDNRGESDDSRYWGPIPESWIVGVAFMRVSPFSTIGFL
jgi:signal peptidase I